MQEDGGSNERRVGKVKGKGKGIEACLMRVWTTNPTFAAGKSSME